MSESSIQSGLQTGFRALSTTFASADVVINDWSILDGSTQNGPFIIIEDAGPFEYRVGQINGPIIWQIPVGLYERFLDNKTTYDNFRTHRQTVLDAVTGNLISAGGLEAVRVVSITADNIQALYDPYNDPDNVRNALPVYVYQRMIFTIEEY